MLTLRLQRIGKLKRPSFRLVVSDKHKDTQAITKEILGYFDRSKKEKPIDFKIDRVKYWLSVGAQPSNTVHNILVNAGIISGAKKQSVYLSTRRKEKIAKKKAVTESV